jgi:hypothetical protein
MERREQVNALKAIALNAGRGISQDPERYGNSLLDSLEYELQQFENKIPNEFWEEASLYAENNLKDEQLKYYYRITD